MPRDHPGRDELHRRPRVMADPGCSTSVDVLKKGPVNIPKVLADGTSEAYKFTDANFGGTNALYWRDAATPTKYSTEAEMKQFDDYLAAGKYFWERWATQWPTKKVFDATQQPKFTDAVQGEAGTCYIMASMSAVAEFPA